MGVRIIRRPIIKISIVFLLLTLVGCSTNDGKSNFASWELVKPTTKLLYRQTSKETGFHGDGTNSYVFELPDDYMNYLTEYLAENDHHFLAEYVSLDHVPKEIHEEILQIQDADLFSHLNAMENFDLVTVPRNNDILIIMIDELNQRIAFVFVRK